jgi:hypothetical protein
MNRLLSLLLLCYGITPAWAAISIGFTGGILPDGSATGISVSTTLNLPNETITGITVNLEVSDVDGDGTFLGDLYFYLTDGDTLVTLLNRPGRSVDRFDGYADTLGIDVTFSDAGVIDAHEYRPAISGDNSTPLSGTLSGILQPDGRITSPTTVVTGDPRSTALSDFNGLSADRTFTLFAADLSGGVLHEIDAWSLEIVTIPEPSAISLFLVIAGLAACHRRRKTLCPRQM